MKITLTVVLLVFCIHNTFAQNTSKNQPKLVPFFKVLTSEYYDPTIFYGFMNPKTGKKVIRAKYWTVWPFVGDVALVEYAGKSPNFYFINNKGDRVSEKFYWVKGLNNKYSDGYYFMSNQRHKQNNWTYDYIVVCLDDNKHGLLNKYGRTIVEFGKFIDFKLTFNNSYITAKISLKKDTKYVLLDLDGAKVLQNEYDYIADNYDDEGYIKLQLNGKIGWLKKDFTQVIDYLYTEALPFCNKKALVKNSNNKWGIIDNNGNELAKFIYSNVVIPINPLLPICAMEREKNIRLFDLNKLEELQIVNIEEVKSDTIKSAIFYKENNLWGFVATNGNNGHIVYPSAFDEISSYVINNTLNYSVRYKNKYGIIKPNGDFFVPPIYDKPVMFKYGLAYVISGGKYGILDLSGEEIAEPIYNSPQEAELALGNQNSALLQSKLLQQQEEIKAMQKKQEETERQINAQNEALRQQRLQQEALERKKNTEELIKNLQSLSTAIQQATSKQNQQTKQNTYKSNNTTTKSSGKHICPHCDGTGLAYDIIKNTSDFGTGGEKWCERCRKYVKVGHYHETRKCSRCNGTGYVNN